MSRKQLSLIILISSFIGGVVSIVGYSLIMQPKNFSSNNAPVHQASFVNYTADTVKVVPEGLNFIFSANSTTPAVVHIRSYYKMEDLPNQGNPLDELFKDYFGNKNSFPMQQREEGITPQGSGSGVIISEDGYIVTNYHVVADAEKIEIVLHDKRSYVGALVGYDPSTDLALLKIKEKGLAPIKFGDSDELPIGSWVLAVGNPFNLTSTVTAGIISAKARSINVYSDRMAVESFIQTDAVVNPGNSGGALVNLKGELVGINTAIASMSGTFAGYAFAVPVSLVKKITEDLRKYGVAQRAVLGVSVTNVSAELAKQKGLTTTDGVFIDSVAAGSAAQKGGLKSGDVITMINESEVNYASRLQEVVATFRPGDKITITYLRKNKSKNTEVLLKNQSGNTQSWRNKKP